MARVLRLSERRIDLATGEVHGHGRLRPIERALLAYLADRAGSFVSVDELHAAVWGFAPGVVSRTAYTAAARVRALVEDDPSAPRHLLSERGAGYRLVDVAWETEAPPFTNLAEPRGLVGRAQELALLLGTPAPLWTVVGAGGVGKTRLAAEVAWRARPPGGAWWCDLQDAATEATVEAEVARALPDLGAGTVVARMRQLGDVLVVLDDADAAGAAAARLVRRWLDEVPRARFLVTARRPLALGEERVLRLGPLPRDEAVALLRERLDRQLEARPAPLTDAQAAALWRLTDGLPLALELAAANVALIGPDAVVERLGDGADLSARRVDAPARHRSLDEVLRWSLDRLDPEAQHGLAVLAVLDGPFGIPAAAAALDDPDAASRLAALVDASLVVASGGRFALLTTVRDAVRRWRPRPAGEVLDRLLHLLRGFDEDAAGRSGLGLAGLLQLVARVERRAELDPDEGARALFAIAREGAADGVRPELLISWLERALARDATDATRAEVLLHRAILRGQLGPDPERHVADCLEAARLARRCGQDALAIGADYRRGAVWGEAGRPAEVEAIVRALDAAAGAGGPSAGHARAAAGLLRALECQRRDDEDGAARHHRAAAAAFREAGELTAAARVEANLAQNLVYLGRVEEADALLATIDDRRGFLAVPLAMQRATVRLEAGDFAEAIRWVGHALARGEATFHLLEYLHALFRGVRILLAAGDTDAAVRWIRARLARPFPEPLGPAQRAWFRAVLALVESGPDAARPLADEAGEAAASRGLTSFAGLVAHLRAELAWGAGDPSAAADALRDAPRDPRPSTRVPAALLLAETRLRLGDRAEARAVALDTLRVAGSAIGRARAHALLATCAALEGDRAGAEAHLRHTIGVRGPGRSWLAVHRAWCGRLLDGRPADPVGVDPDGALELALRACAAEVACALPPWAG